MACDACKRAPLDGKVCRYCGEVRRDQRLERLANDIRSGSPDRERIDFVRRAAIHIWVELEHMGQEYAADTAVIRAVKLWDALQKAGC